VPHSSLTRTIDAGPADGAPHVVIVPGLGLPAYLLPLVRALAAAGARCSLLDVPGFGGPGPLACAPTLDGAAIAVAQFLSNRPEAAPVVLVGHSTGAQVALRAALLVQGRRPVAGLVLAGPTVAPTQRSLVRLAAVTPAAFRRDSPRELVVVPQLLRGGPDVVRLLRSALADRPEAAVAALTAPLTVTAGRSDSYAPAWWLDVLVAGAVRSPSAHRVVLPGSHNNPFTHAEDVADVVLSASCAAARRS
jgi:pimeloyl-ACP methyl ester carboxylesterase